MRRCAICGFKVRKNLCNRCYRKYCLDKDGGLITHKDGEKSMQSRYPKWIQELIKIENHNYYQNHVKNKELVSISFEEVLEEEL